VGGVSQGSVWEGNCDRFRRIQSSPGRVRPPVSPNPMKLLRSLALVPLLVTLALAADPNSLTSTEKAAGWKLLFDGTSLAGWRSLASDKPGDGWQVQDGAITLAHGKAGDLLTAEDYGDFEFSFEWKVADESNSGVIYRVGLGESQTFFTGPEYQVLDNAKAEDNKLPSHLAASLYDLAAPPADFTEPVGQWNTAKIRVRGWHIEHWLNGEKVVDVDLSTPEGKALIAASKFKDWPKFASLLRGHIALQDHGHPVWFRAIKVRELK